MMIAFKRFSQNPEADPDIPMAYPWIKNEIDDECQKDFEDQGFECLEPKEFDALCMGLQPQIETYLASKQPKKYAQADFEKYLKRADRVRFILAEQAAENVAKIRAGLWRPEELFSLLRDPQSVLVNHLVNALSFEFAILVLQNHTHPLMTKDVKNALIEKIVPYV
jgi:hypothetical protein